jgi:hypothetical protein
VQAVSYAQVGDFFKMLVHREESGYAACEFCRTVNSQYAVRCRTCGGMLSPNSEEDTVSEPVKPAKSSVSDARALRSVLTMVLVPPLILFASFGTWHQLQFETPESAVAHVTPSATPVTGEAVHPAAPVYSQERLVSELLAGKKTNVHEDVERGLPPPLPEVQAQAPDQDYSSRATNAGSASPHASKASQSRARDAAAAAARPRQDVLAGCSGLGFLARAVCVNNRCAEPKAARVGQCREAVRQRRIDEARRNPVLMG